MGVMDKLSGIFGKGDKDKGNNKKDDKKLAPQPAKPAADPKSAPLQKDPVTGGKKTPLPIAPSAGFSEITKVDLSKQIKDEKKADEAADHLNTSEDKAAIANLITKYQHPESDAAARLEQHHQHEREKEFKVMKNRIQTTLNHVLSHILMMQGLDAALRYQSPQGPADCFTDDEAEEYADILLGVLVSMNTYGKDDDRKAYRQNLWQFLSSPGFDLLDKENAVSLENKLTGSVDAISFSTEILQDTKANYAAQLSQCSPDQRAVFEQKLSGFIKVHQPAMRMMGESLIKKLSTVTLNVPIEGFHQDNLLLREKVKSITAPCVVALTTCLSKTQ